MDSLPINQLRYAVVGVGAGVFGMHRAALQLPSLHVVAVADVNREGARQRGEELHCPFYDSHRQLLEEVKPDVVVIMTPHPYHAQIAIDSLQAGSHVLVEKPMAVQVSEADAMIEAAERAQRIVGVIFQHRFRPEIRAAHQLIQSGQIGQVQHVSMTAVWTRTAHYYQSASWRGTWNGEGGGVLMNQACHHLDLLCHLVGEPARTFAWTRRILHAIETEDTVQAVLEWPNGALGSLHISTAEADQAEYLKIVGTHGQLELNGGLLTHRALDTDITNFVLTHSKAMAAPPMYDVPVEIDTNVSGNHCDVYRAFNTAVIHGTPFTSAAREGRMSLELANAFIYASYTNSPIEFPLSRQNYAALIHDLINKKK